MSAEQENAQERLSARLQFNLRTLFGLTAAVALGMGMWAWRAEYGLLLYFLGVSLCVVAVGAALRRVGLIVVGVALLLGTWYGVQFSARRTSTASGFAWVGGTVPVRVVDAATGEPVPGATVRILSGPNASTARRVPTNHEGRAAVECELPVMIERTRHLLGVHERRWIGLGGVAAVVEAKGYVTARVPLRTQLEERYDAGDGRRLPELRVELQPEEPLDSPGALP